MRRLLVAPLRGGGNNWYRNGWRTNPQHIVFKNLVRPSTSMSCSVHLSVGHAEFGKPSEPLYPTSLCNLTSHSSSFSALPPLPDTSATTTATKKAEVANGVGRDARSETIINAGGGGKNDAKHAATTSSSSSSSANNTKNTAAVGVSSSSSPSSKTGSSSAKPERELGQFHHLPHYVKLYDVLKSAHSNCR